MRQEKINEIKSMIPLMTSMVSQDVAIGIWDRSGTVLYFEKPQTFNFVVECGYQLPDKNDKLYVAMETGKTQHNILPKEAFGVALEGNLVPIFDGDEVVGCISCVFCIDNVKTMEEKLNDVTKFMNILETKVNNVFGVVNSINMNASRTKMLAFNASIEAARAGESGKGFSIVASEMRKLSQMSADATSEIETNLNDVVKSMSDVIKALSVFDDDSNI